MATSVRRKKTAFDPVRTFLEHLTLKGQEAAIKARSEELKKRLKEWLPSNYDYTNEQGSLFFDLPETLNVNGVNYKGMELRRSKPDPLFNEDRAEALLKSKGLYERATVPVLDQDKIYRLLQEEELTEDEIDSMFDEQDEKFAFWPVKGEVFD